MSQSAMAGGTGGVAGGAGGVPPGPRDQCAVWCARGAQAPEPLVNGMRRRAVQLWTCDDPYHAVARACLMQRTTPAGAAALLVLCEPTSLAQLGEAYDALKKFAGRVAVWWYQGGASPTLRPVTLEDMVEWTAMAGRGAAASTSPQSPAQPMSPRFNTPIPARTQSGPGLRLVQTEGEAESPGASPTALTSEELAMLLGDEPPSAHPRRGEAS